MCTHAHTCVYIGTLTPYPHNNNNNKPFMQDLQENNPQMHSAASITDSASA